MSVLRTNAPDSQGDREAVTDAEGDLDSEVVAGDPTRRERWSLASVDWRAVGRSLGPAAGIVALQLVFFPLSMGLFVHGMIIGGLTALIALGMALI